MKPPLMKNGRPVPNEEQDWFLGAEPGELDVKTPSDPEAAKAQAELRETIEREKAEARKA